MRSVGRDSAAETVFAFGKACGSPASASIPLFASHDKVVSHDTMMSFLRHVLDIGVLCLPGKEIPDVSSGILLDFVVATDTKLPYDFVGTANVLG